MMTQKQILDLSHFYHIDEFTIRREFIQILFLNSLYQQPKATHVFFKGGTALRLLYNFTRFSEDLDFTTTYTFEEIKKILIDVEESLQYDLPGLRIVLLYSGTKGVRYRIKYNATDFKYPFVIRLDLSYGKKLAPSETTVLSTRFPIGQLPIITHLAKKELFAEKIRALYGRSKGRDFFDVWYFFKNGEKPDWDLVIKKSQEDKNSFKHNLLLKKVATFSDKQLQQDLAQFLPRTQKKIIPLIKKELLQFLHITN